MSVLVAVIYCFDSFVISLEVRKCDASSFVLIIALAIQGLLWFYVNFRGFCSISIKKQKKDILILIGID